jgi:ribosomal-protein-alanine N-acetyltransferase
MPIDIRRIQTDAEAHAAADIMASTEPWITLGRRVEHTYRAVTNPNFECYVAVENDIVAGIIILAIDIPLINGYIAALAVRADSRNRGIGRRLLAFAEERIARASPNVFLTVSSFNTSARRFYKRHGYELIGELAAYSVPGHSELLMRKTTGPWSTFVRSESPG